MNMVIPVAYVSCMVLKGGEATATRTCPLWSDNKAIHEEALAKAAEEAREKLKQESFTTGDLVELGNAAFILTKFQT